MEGVRGDREVPPASDAAPGEVAEIPEVEETAEAVMWVPKTDWLLQPILAIVPLQLLAYRVARARGLNIDQPRNLAKTVTVE
jgi:glucosamine--fructose-6-phosphate aminotransferase (isomerizing)